MLSSIPTLVSPTLLCFVRGVLMLRGTPLLDGMNVGINIVGCCSLTLAMGWVDTNLGTFHCGGGTQFYFIFFYKRKIILIVLKLCENTVALRELRQANLQFF